MQTTPPSKYRENKRFQIVQVSMAPPYFWDNHWKSEEIPVFWLFLWVDDANLCYFCSPLLWAFMKPPFQLRGLKYESRQNRVTLILLQWRQGFFPWGIFSCPPEFPGPEGFLLVSCPHKISSSGPVPSPSLTQVRLLLVPLTSWSDHSACDILIWENAPAPEPVNPPFLPRNSGFCNSSSSCLS